VGLAQRRRPRVGLPWGDRAAGRERAGPAVAAVGGVELLVEPERVVAEVAEEEVGEAAAVADLVVGVDLPADPGLLQLIGVGRDLLAATQLFHCPPFRAAWSPTQLWSRSPSIWSVSL
jgi:hypothetical protein